MKSRYTVKELLYKIKLCERQTEHYRIKFERVKISNDQEIKRLKEEIKNHDQNKKLT